MPMGEPPIEPTENRSAIHGVRVQEIWPGRLCDVCRRMGYEQPSRAQHAVDHPGGGRDFYCDPHWGEEEPWQRTSRQP